MRILLQQIDSGLYLQEAGGWTPKPSEAIDFLNSSAAIEYCIANQVTGVHLVLKFDEQHHDIVLPLIGTPEDGQERPRSSL